MAEVTTDELATLQREFDWLLAQEVHLVGHQSGFLFIYEQYQVPAVLSQLREAVTECASKFPVPVLSSVLALLHHNRSYHGIIHTTQVGSHNADRPNSSDKFVLTTTDQLKVLPFQLSLCVLLI